VVFEFSRHKELGEGNHDRFLFVMSRATVVAYAPAATALVVGVALQCVTIANHDVAWLITLAERLLQRRTS